jgi:hypothetical protein
LISRIPNAILLFLANPLRKRGSIIANSISAHIAQIVDFSSTPSLRKYLKEILKMERFISRSTSMPSASDSVKTYKGRARAVTDHEFYQWVEQFSLAAFEKSRINNAEKLHLLAAASTANAEGVFSLSDFSHLIIIYIVTVHPEDS